MFRSFNEKQIGLAVACTLALGIVSGAARAQDARPETAKDRQYVEDTRANVVRSGFGLCWHSGFGPPPAAGGECNPGPVALAPPVRSVPVPPPAMVERPAVVAAPVAPAPVYVAPQRPAKRDRN